MGAALLLPPTSARADANDLHLAAAEAVALLRSMRRRSLARCQSSSPCRLTRRAATAAAAAPAAVATRSPASAVVTRNGWVLPHTVYMGATPVRGTQLRRVGGRINKVSARHRLLDRACDIAPAAGSALRTERRASNGP